MKLKINLPVTVLFILSLFFVTSCDLVTGIFETGVGVGIFIAVVILVLIFFIGRIGRRR
jgi:ABC-type polysaccharide transport system permease subunit